MNHHQSIGIRRCAMCRPTAHGRAAGDRVCPVAAGRLVHARFTPSDLPVLTSSPHRAAALRAISRTLAHLGRGYLGGHAEITCDAALPRGCRALTLTECLAAVRAVENALTGGRGTAWLPLPGRRRRPANHGID